MSVRARLQFIRQAPFDAFVEMMNEKAQELGAVNTHYMNAHGLDDDDHYTTAHDMAIIFDAALKK